MWIRHLLDRLSQVVPDEETREEICRTIEDNAQLDLRFVLMNLLAAVVATYGLLADSTATVIGAMVMATLIGAISGIALAIVHGDSKLLRDSLLATVAGVAIVLAVSIPIGWFHQWMPLSREVLARTHPTVLDLAIAVAGGAAGAFATVSPRVSAGLVGVAIATALVPPVAVCGICLSRGEFGFAAGAFELFLTNFAAIQVTTSVMMWLFGFHRAGRLSWLQVLHRNRVSIAVLAVLGTLLTLNLFRTFNKLQVESAIRHQIMTAVNNVPQAELIQLTFEYRPRRRLLVKAIVVTPYQFEPHVVAGIKQNLPLANKQHIDLRLLSLLLSSNSLEPPSDPAP